jgi:hypothetical protein
VKRIIEGKAYDTETATLVATADHGDERSQAWWSLYRTRDGAFFEVVADHDGVLEGFYPLTDKQAQAFLEANANDLVEHHFGPMPELGASRRESRFSRRTIIAAIEAMDTMTQASLTRFILTLGADFSQHVPAETTSVARRLNTLIQLFDRDPERRVDSGELLGNALVDHAISLLPKQRPPSPWSKAKDLPPCFATFIHSLQLDGFVITDGALRRALPASLKLPEAQDEIVRLLNKHDFAIAKGHLDQAFTAHTDGHWASANSQIRSFLEGLLDAIAEKIDPSITGKSSGQQRRTTLAAHKFISRDLNEWDDNGLGFINGLMKRLHPHGSHPGLSDEDDSTFRLHTVLLTARLLLVRFDRWPTP